MDREAFIVGQNLAKFRDLLGREQEPAKRRMLEELIEEERRKLDPSGPSEDGRGRP